jgi:indole-3-glycerol phosphate synthase
MQQPNRSFIYTLAESARKTISEGYYEVQETRLPRRSLRGAIRPGPRIPIITEVKFRSPAEGTLRAVDDVVAIAQSYERGGAAGVSVLTEPKHFDGRIQYLSRVKKAVSLPVLMKDIVVSPIQIEAASRIGADAVLLMASIFRAKLADAPLDAMVGLAHAKGLEVLLEAHTKEEYVIALASSADIVGINNRDLETLQVSLDTSRRLLLQGKDSKTVISESGLSRRSELLELRALGADGFLVGSSLMRSKDIEGSVRELAGA